MPLNAAPPSDLFWYVVHTKPRQEALAVENLRRQEFEVYLPMFKTFKVPRRGRVKKPGDVMTGVEPMFPRYLFLRPARATQSLSTVRSTLGVSRLVMFGAQPATIRQALLDDIRTAEALRDQADISEVSPYQPGMTVRLQNPAFASVQALVQAVSVDRVTLLLEILGRPQLLNVDFSQILPV
ncbi:transcriptional activator RfaH [Alcaligenaceae bacterium CGII-47]|nr:transcriptional activator RfaH [Alcaligenaceae bacterium CGII-47]